MSETQLLRCLQKDLQNFFDDLIESFPTEGDLVIARHLVGNQLPMSDVMDYILKVLLPLKEKVDNRDNNFFLENNILFEALDNRKVNHFKNIWKSENLTDEDRECIWKWFDRFLMLAERYQKCKRRDQQIKIQT